jgi:hypothetical protein
VKNAALIEMLVSFGIVLALAVWDLLRTPRPTDQRDEIGDESQVSARKSDASDSTASE